MRNQFDRFEDDGGTPMWRARHSRVIDVQPRGLKSWFNRQKLAVLMLWAISLAFALPFIVFFGGLLAAYMLDRATGRWP